MTSEGARGKLVQRLRAVGGIAHGETLALEPAAHDSSDGGVVIDDQDHRTALRDWSTVAGVLRHCIDHARTTSCTRSTPSTGRPAGVREKWGAIPKNVPR